MPAKAFCLRPQFIIQLLMLSVCMISLYLVPAVRAQATLVQKTSHSIGDLSNSVSFSSSNTAGNLIIVSVGWVNGGNATVSDSRGNTYVSAVGPTVNAVSSQIWYATNIAGGPNTVTAAFGGVWNNSIIAVFEYSGLATSSALDVAGAATGRSNALETGPVTTTQANELIFASGYGDSGGTLSAGPNYTMQMFATQTGTGLGLEDRSVISAGSYNATFSDTNAWDWVAQIASFKIGSSTSSLCGVVNDGLTHPAPNYNTFAPGAVGTTYNDQQYGCPITRISDGKTYCNSASPHQYSTISAINADDSLVVMGLAWQCNPPVAYYVVNASGQVVVDQFHFPPANTLNIPWDQFDANTFYYTINSTLYKGTINRTAGTVTQSALCSFTGYTEVDIPDQEDISYDNNRLWLVGYPDSQSGEAFLVTLTPSTGPHTACTRGATVNIGPQTETDGIGWHKIQITAGNKLAVLSNVTNTTELYNTNGTLFRRMADTNHMDFGFDSDGVTEVAIGMFYQGTLQNGCPRNYGLGVQNLATGTVIRCLLPDLGNDNSWHISFRDSSPRGPGRLLLSVERSGQGCDPVNGSGTDMSCFNGNDGWYPYSGEEILLRIDGSEVRRLAHHRSRSSVAYWPQPRGSLSKDGKVVIFGSNFNNFNGGATCTAPNTCTTYAGLDYVDTYLIRVQQ